MLNEDYKDMLRCLLEEGVSFLLVGAYAMAAHGLPRATLDIDFWVDPNPENARAVMRALVKFGAPLDQLTVADLSSAGTIFQIGVPPRRIDIITSIDGLDFRTAYSRALTFSVDGMEVRVPNREDLIRNKRATGRTKDRADAEWLEDQL